jgi:hypothetical protein
MNAVDCAEFCGTINSVRENFLQGLCELAAVSLCDLDCATGLFRMRVGCASGLFVAGGLRVCAG